MRGDDTEQESKPADRELIRWFLKRVLAGRKQFRQPLKFVRQAHPLKGDASPQATGAHPNGAGAVLESPGSS